MHPALSVVFFTTATGAGYGLLAILGVFAVLGLLPGDRLNGFISTGLALGLITLGLLSSTGHLGRPERAWRAFSQWRSSWLSREGVSACLTYIPAAIFAAAWVFLGETGGWAAAAGLVAAIGAVITVCMTGMIYASLKPIVQWHSPYTLPGYLVYSAASGLTLFNAIQHGFGASSRTVIVLACLSALIAWVWKRVTWRRDDGIAIASTVNSATGLAGGTVQTLEWPHTEENYLLKEMGFRVARKHRMKLRGIAQLLAFALPAALLLISLMLPGAATVFAIAAAVSQFLGLLVERWLFFAEATHTVMLYYGRAA